MARTFFNLTTSKPLGQRRHPKEYETLKWAALDFRLSGRKDNEHWLSYDDLHTFKAGHAKVDVLLFGWVPTCFATNTIKINLTSI